MLVIEKNGNVHHFTSNLPDQIFYDGFESAMKGSYNIHNHPRNKTQYTFSKESDVPAMFKDGTEIMEAYDYKYIYHMERAEGVTFEKWDEERYKAEHNIAKIMDEHNYSFDDYQEQKLHLIIDEACKKCGIKYYRRLRK